MSDDLVVRVRRENQNVDRALGHLRLPAALMC
jgi:hypothetical protein